MEANTPETSIAQYEQIVKQLVNNPDSSQVWQVDSRIIYQDCWDLVLERRFPDNFELVATVKSQSLDEIWRLTNHWHEWKPNCDVLSPVPPYGVEDGIYDGDLLYHLPRSSMVGDVFILPDASMHVVGRVGFVKLG